MKENLNHGTQDKPEDKDKGNSGNNNQIDVLVRFQSETVSVRINVNASLNALLEKAIEETKNDISIKDRFQLKLGELVLDIEKKVKDYPITNGTLLTLGLLAGGGGTR